MHSTPEETLSRKKESGTLFPYAGFSIGATTLALEYYWIQRYPDLTTNISNATFIALAFLAFVSSLGNIRLTSHISIVRRWLCFSLGTLLLLMAETTWSIYSSILGIEVPYPSIADVTYLGGLVSLLVGLVWQLFSSRLVSVSAGRHFLAVLISLIAGAATFGYHQIMVMPLYGKEELLTIQVDTFYFGLEFALLLIGVYSVVVYLTHEMRVAYEAFLIGILLWIVADQLFSYYVFNGLYYNGHPVELLYLTGYLGITLSFVLFHKSLKTMPMIEAEGRG